MKYLSLLLALTLTACATSNSGDVYSREETRQVQHIKMAVVESVRQVQIEGTEGTIGAVAGGAVGGAVGNTVGSGTGRTLATVVGAVVGAVAGKMAESELTKADGVEITVKMDDSGELLAIVQEATDEFHPGEKVRLLESGGVTRVSH